MPDLDSIVEDAFLKSQTDKADSGKTEATPAPKADEAAAPEKTEAEKADAHTEESPARETEPPATPDSGAPQATEPEKKTEPTPTVADALAEAYKLADIDPTDPQAATKLAAHLKAAKDAKAPEVPKEEEPKLATDDEIQKDFDEFILNDKECLTLADQFNQYATELTEQAAQIKTCNETIAKLDARLNPPKIEGVPDVELSEVEESDIQRRLDNAWRDHSRLTRKIESNIQKRDAITGKWKERAESHLKGKLDERDNKKQEAADKVESTAWAKREQGEFETAFEVEFKESKLPAEVKARAHENVFMRAHAQMQKFEAEGKGQLIEDKRAYFKHLLKSEVDAYESHHKLKSRDYGNDKRTDAKVTAPDGVSEKHQPGGQQKAVARDKHEARDEILDNARAARSR